MIAKGLLLLMIATQDPTDDKETPLSQVERKNKAPVNKDLLRVKLPKPFEGTIDNGLQVMILEDHRAPLVSAQLTMYGAGELYSGQTGVAHLTAQMLMKGTKSKKAREIFEEADRLGLSLNVSAGYGGEATVVSVSGLTENFEKGLALAGDLFVNPTFPEDEFEKLKQREIASLTQIKTSPRALLGAKFGEVLYGAHPAAIEMPTADQLKSITRDMLIKWHRDRYVPQNAILTIAGDVDTKQIFGRVKLLSWVWKRAPVKLALPETPKPAEERAVHLVDRPGSVQSAIRVGAIAIPRGHEDWIALNLVTRVLGGGSAARLFAKLREEKGYSYGIYSRLESERFPGPWSSGGDVKGDATGDALTDLLAEIQKVCDEPIPAAELEENKRATIARFALSLEQPSQVMAYHAERKRHGLPADYWDQYAEKIAALTAEDLQKVAQKYLASARLQVVAVGDARKVKPMLEKFGAVSISAAEATGGQEE